MTQTKTTIKLFLTEEQLTTLHAALVAANQFCRDKEMQYLELHESDKVGQVTRAESWIAFKKWESYENHTCQVMEQIQAQASLGFSAWQRLAA